jgi:universal stress protein G
MFQRVLVAVDIAFREHHSKTLATAAELARAGDGHLRLVYVRYLIEAAVQYIPEETLRKDERDALTALRNLSASLDLPKDRVSVVSPVGRAYSEILKAAAEFAADVIVIGPHSPSMAKFLLGSDAHRIVQHAPISVLVVR